MVNKGKKKTLVGNYTLATSSIASVGSNDL